jgi:hypothetical protein
MKSTPLKEKLQAAGRDGEGRGAIPEHHALKKIRRKGSGRRKGKFLKALRQGTPSHRLAIKSYSGETRLGVRRLYDCLRTLALYTKNHDVKSSPQLHREISKWIKGKGFPREMFEILFVLVSATRKSDGDFFKSFAAAFEKWNANAKTIDNRMWGQPSDDPELELLLELKTYYDIPPFPPMFYTGGERVVTDSWTPAIQDKLDMPIKERPRLTLTEIQELIKNKLGYDLSLSSISEKAKIVGLPVHRRFGR